MFNPLDASKFLYNEFIYTAEFEDILGKIIRCYQIMLEDEVELSNDENKIRDVLVNDYINNPKIKEKLEFKYFIFPEVPETETAGRTDIRIHSPVRYYNQNTEYYIIECKRLNANNQQGKTGLNAKYIESGICRFSTNYYSSHYQVNGMIGFVVDDIDNDENVTFINNLLISFPKSYCSDELVKNEFSIKDNFEYSYLSNHSINESTPLKIYHLMLGLHPLMEN